MMIIKIEPNEIGQHLFESQSHRVKCWIDGYVAVPEALENKVSSCIGYCDLTIKNGVLIDVQGHPERIPENEPENGDEPTANELINAMLGVTSYE